MRGAPFSGRARTRASILAATAAGLVLLGACSEDDPGPDRPAATGLTEPAAGRLVRILGDGTWDLLDRLGPAATSSVNRPAGLVALPDGTLLGIQGVASFPGLFTLTPSGEAAPVDGSSPGAPGLQRGYPVAATADGGRYLVALASGQLEMVDRGTGAALGSVALPARAPTSWAAAFLRIGDRTVLQYGDRWLAVTGLDLGRPQVTPIEAPVADVIAAAQEERGSLLLVPGRLVRLDHAGDRQGEVPILLPDEVEGMTVTTAAADGRGGLVVALAVRSAARFGDSGALVHVRADGSTTLLARGSKPGSGQDCDDSDTAATEAHLAQPLSVAVWQHRVVVADTECNSLLTLPLTDD